MVVKEIWVTRHGFREDWINPNTTSPTGLGYDSPLSKSGRKQTRELCNYLMDKDIQVVYSSPFYRVLETVTPLVMENHIPHYLENALAEWYGKDVDYRKPAPSDVLKHLFPHLDLSHDTIDLPTGRESVVCCHERAERGMHKLITQLDEENKYERILLVGHAASVICVIRALLRESSFPVRVGTASLSRLVRKEDGTWELKENGDCHYLSEGEQRPWTFSGDVPDYTYKNAL
ncbi:phosphoglycerate mutase-like protein [Backusella circina FSU 941]|nr:phosphoglycerate mutase-like protein [Backusella circina FSU 941]